MTPGAVVVGVLLVTMWLLALTSRRLRNWRGVAVLLAASVAIVVPGILAPRAAPWLQIGVWLILVEFLFVRGGLLALVGRADDSFIEEYIGYLRHIAEMKKRAPTTEPVEYLADFADVISGLQTLKPPSAELAELNSDTIRELERRLVLLKLSTRPPPETFERMNAEWDRIEKRLERILAARSR